MNLVTGSEEIILNDTFETQRTSPYNLLLASNNIEEKLPDTIKNYTFGNYTYSSAQPLPVPSEEIILGESLSSSVPPRKNSWNIYYLNQSRDGLLGWDDRPDGVQLSSIFDLGPDNENDAIKIIRQEYPGITDGIFINVGHNDGPLQLYYDITDQNLSTFQKNSSGCCSFTIAILPLLLTNTAELDNSAPAIPATVRLKEGVTVPTSIDDFYDPPLTGSNPTVKNYFQNFTSSDSTAAWQQNIISFVCNNPDSSNDDILITLNYRSFYDTVTDSWEVRLYNDVGQRESTGLYKNDLIYAFDGNDGRVRWDGLSLKKFNCYYQYKDGQFTGKLYLVDGDREIFISDQIKKSREAFSIFGKSPIIGIWRDSTADNSWNSQGRCCLVLSQFALKTDVKQEKLSFAVDNVHRITWQAAKKESFGQYTYSDEQPTPVKQLALGSTTSELSLATYPNPNDWNLIYSYAGSTASWNTPNNARGVERVSVFDLNFEKNGVLCKAYPGLANSIFINKWKPAALQYFFREIKEGSEDDLRIKKTGIGSCTFTIGLLPLALCNRSATAGNSAVLGEVRLKSGITEAKSIDDFFEEYSGQIISEFKTNDIKYQANFISFGNYNKDNKGPTDDKFRFVLMFRTIYSAETNSWEVRVYDNYSIRDDYNNYEIYRFDGKNGRIRWDGLTLQKFKCYYEPTDAEGSFASIKGRLYFIDENNNEILLAENINKTADGSASFPNSPTFGCYSLSGTSCLAISQFEFTANVNDSYEFTLDSTPYNFTPFYDKLKNEMTYAISGTSEVDVDWKFLNGKNTNEIQNTNKIEISDNWISRDNITAVDYFGKKNKQITIASDIGSITSFNNPSKKITTIDISQLTTISSLNLSNNLIQNINLTDNFSLTDVNLSYNNNLKKVILPRTLSTANLDIDLSNCPKLSTIIFPEDDISGKTFNINVTNTPNIKYIEINNTGSSTATINIISGDEMPELEKLTLHNVSIDNLSTLNLQNSKKLKAVDISESALLLDKSKLETFLQILPDRTGLDVGKIYLYGEKYTYNNIKGHTSAISAALETIKNKNWLFYL